MNTGYGRDSPFWRKEERKTARCAKCEQGFDGQRLAMAFYIPNYKEAGEVHKVFFCEECVVQQLLSREQWKRLLAGFQSDVIISHEEG